MNRTVAEQELETLEADISGLAALARQWEESATRSREERNVWQRRAERAEQRVRELEADVKQVEGYHQVAAQTIEDYCRQVKTYRRFVVDVRAMLSPEMRRRALKLPRMNEYLEAPTLFGDEPQQEGEKPVER